MLCVFPKDESLHAFEPLVDFLKTKIEIAYLNLDNCQEVVDKIKLLPDSSSVIFIGHGSSFCLYSSISRDDRSQFVNSENIEILRNKKIIALACRSSDFLSSHKGLFNSYIGFGNIPSDWSEVNSERDTGDPNYLIDIKKDDLDFYVNIIVEISIFCFRRFVNTHSVSLFYYDFRLHLNRTIYRLLKRKDKENYKGLVSLFLSTRDEMEFYI